MSREYLTDYALRKLDELEQVYTSAVRAALIGGFVGGLVLGALAGLAFAGYGAPA